MKYFDAVNLRKSLVNSERCKSNLYRVYKIFRHEDEYGKDRFSLEEIASKTDFLVMVAVNHNYYSAKLGKNYIEQLLEDDPTLMAYIKKYKEVECFNNSFWVV